MPPTVVKKPVKIQLRTYQVGFGDCFLLSFVYSEKDDNDSRHILIDFGSTGLPKEFNEDKVKTYMLEVAEQIRKDCNKKLHVIVATHRHKDHISGFSTSGVKNANGETSGDIIASCLPEMIIQPWTEDPELDDKKVKTGKSHKMVKDEDFKISPQKNFAATLLSMQRVAALVTKESERLGNKLPTEEDTIDFAVPLDTRKKNQLFFLGDNNIANESAVMNLRKMGQQSAAEFVSFGTSQIGLSKILPGVTVKFLGPPTLEQHHEIIKQRSRDDDEFWMFQTSARNFWGVQAMTANLVDELNERNNNMPDRLFPNAKVYQNYAPSHTRWFIRQVRNLRAAELLGIVRILDKAMNNTSVIMLFEVGDKKLLFPGDAQIENWEYALSKPEIKKLLRETTLYKVGHHGSRNATPKTLWNEFGKKSTNKENPERLKTINSTMAGKHGHTRETAVPRETLVNELDNFSEYHTTQNIKIDDTSLCEKIEIKV